MNPKVSIIIPVYNTEIFLEQCLTSAVNQTLKEIEIIIVNDASTDKSLTIIKNFQGQDSRIKLIDFKENKGNGFGRNQALSEAIGDYILFLDSDDWLELSSAEKTYNKATIENRVVVLIGYTEHLTYVNNDKKNKTLYLPTLTNGDDEFFRHYMLQSKGLHSMPWLYLFSRKLLINSEAQFSIGIYYEDVIFITKALFYANSIGVINNETLYNYRIRKNSITTTLSKKHIDDRFTAFNLTKSFLEEKGVFKKYENEYICRLIVSCAFLGFTTYYRMPKSKKDAELDSYMEMLRKSKLLGKNNLLLVKHTSTKLQDDPRAYKLYEVAYKSLYMLTNHFFVYRMSAKLSRLIMLVLYPSVVKWSK